MEDTGLTAIRNIGVSALEEGRNTELTAVGNNGDPGGWYRDRADGDRK